MTRSDDIRHLLFITLSNIGDAVMTTPVLSYLTARYPQARIDVVADPRSSELFTPCAFVERIFLKKKRAGLAGKLAFVRALRKRRYDLIVDLRTDGLAYLLRTGRRLTKRDAITLGPHSVQQHMGVIQSLNTEARIPPAHLCLSEQDHQKAVDLLAQWPAEARLLALAPGANWQPKIWPAASFAELANLMHRDFDGVLLLGGPGDRQRAGQVADILQLPHQDLCGVTDLRQAGAVLSRARLFVGNDSGLGHLAAAVGTPTLSVFGPGQPERYHPWGTHSFWLVAPDKDLGRLEPTTVNQFARDKGLLG